VIEEAVIEIDFIVSDNAVDAGVGEVVIEDSFIVD